MKNKGDRRASSSTSGRVLNRVDDTIVFPQLTQEEIVQIVDLEIAKLDKRLKDKDMGDRVAACGQEPPGQEGLRPVLGARPLRRTIQREIEDTLSEKILYAVPQVRRDRPCRHRGEGEDSGSTFTGTPHPGAIQDLPWWSLTPSDLTLRSDRMPHPHPAVRHT